MSICINGEIGLPADGAFGSVPGCCCSFLFDVDCYGAGKQLQNSSLSAANKRWWWWQLLQMVRVNEEKNDLQHDLKAKTL